jgi:hypothetical protein
MFVGGVARAHGAVYEDVDRVFEGHRFCEEGVVEPELGREGTWFFNVEYNGEGWVGDGKGSWGIAGARKGSECSAGAQSRAFLT